MRTIAIVNEKGGTGKTTTSVNLAAAMGQLGHRVLLVDLDGQGASSRWLGVEDDNRLADALLAGESLEPIPDVLPGVALAPGTGKLDSVAHDLRPTQGGQLRKVLAKLADRYEFTLIDCPPSLGNRLIGNALLASTHVIVPVETSILALDGLKILLTTLEDVREGFGHEIALAGVLACRYDGRTRLSKLVLEELRRALPGKVFGTVIRENVRMRECPASGQSILAFAPESHAAEDYMALGREVLELFEREAAMPSAVDALKADLTATTFNLDHLRENAAASVRGAAARRQGRGRADEPEMHTDAQWRNDGVIDVDEDEAPSEEEWATVGSPVVSTEPPRAEATEPPRVAADASEQGNAPAPFSALGAEATMAPAAMPEGTVAESAAVAPATVAAMAPMAVVAPEVAAPAAPPVEAETPAWLKLTMDANDTPAAQEQPVITVVHETPSESEFPSIETQAAAEAAEPPPAEGPVGVGVGGAADAFEREDAPSPVSAPRPEGDYPALRAMLKEIQQRQDGSPPSSGRDRRDSDPEKSHGGLFARIFTGK